MSHLFAPLNLGPLTIENRIVIAPMCQYSANDGNASNWHLMHLGNLALSGAGLLIIEATAVESRGRISWGDLGLWSDANEAALAEVLAAIRLHSKMPIGIQLAHAGRKASCDLPWKGGRALAPEAVNGWTTIGASALPFLDGDPIPMAAESADLDTIVEAFVAAARRADRLGLDLIELHAAHGYLLHQFLSPLSNRRHDEYGGDLGNRLRFPLRVFDAVRAVLPAHRPLGMRISATDWIEGGWDLQQSLELAKALDARGCSYIHVSSGGSGPQQQIVLEPGYQLPFAEAIRKAVKMPVIGVGLITDPQQAETALVEGHADAIALARAMLYDPRWPWHAAAKLGGQVAAPPQYLRSEPAEARGSLRRAD